MNEEPGRSKLRKHVAQLPPLGSALCVTMVSRCVLRCVHIVWNIYEVRLKDFQRDDGCLIYIKQWLCACVRVLLMLVLFWSSTALLGHLNHAVCQAGVGGV